MKKMSKMAMIVLMFFTATAAAQVNLQKTANNLNGAAAQGQQVIGGTQNAIAATVGAFETGKQITSGLKSLFGKKKNSSNKAQEQQAKETDTEQSSATAGSYTTATITPEAESQYVLTVYFDKIDYGKLKEIKEALAANAHFSEVKMNFKEGNNYLAMKNTSISSDEVVSFILDKWGSNFTVESDEAAVKKLKAK